MSIVYKGKVIAKLTKILEFDEDTGKPVITFEMPFYPESDTKYPDGAKDFSGVGTILVQEKK